MIFRIDYVLGADGNRLGALEARGTDVVRWRYKFDALGHLVRERRDMGDDGPNYTPTALQVGLPSPMIRNAKRGE